MSVDIKYIPLSFITADDEILKQIKNTVLFSHLFQSFDSTSLSFYLESTQYGYTASASEKGTHQLVRITDINSGNVNWNTVPYCDCDVEDKYLLKDDDILVARTGGTTGKSFVVNSAPKNAVFASYLIRLRLKKDINLDFITLFLNSYLFWSQIVEMKSGSAMPNVNAEKLKTLIIPKLSAKEQNEFVAAFQNIENKNQKNNIFDKIEEVESLYLESKEIVTELNHQLDLIKQLRQAFLREAMQGKLVKSTNTKETGQQLLEKIKAEKAQLIAEKKLKKEKELPAITEDEIPFEIPEHWAWCRFQDITKVITCGLASTPIYRKEGKKFLSAKNIKPFKFMPEDFKYVDEETYNKVTKNAKPEINDILITRVGAGIGETALIDKEIDFAYYVSLTLVKPFNEIYSKYLVYWLNSPTGIQSAISFTTGTGSSQGNLNVEKVRSFLIPIPPLHEQEQIVAKLEELMAFCDGLEQSIKESQGYNEKLLQQVLREALQGEEV